MHSTIMMFSELYSLCEREGRRTARSYNDQGLQAGVSISTPISPRAASVRLLFTMLHPRCDKKEVSISFCIASGQYKIDRYIVDM